MSGDAAVTACRQRGAGLVEVSISLLLLSIGALGLGQLQLSAKRIGFEAVQRTEAAALATDLFERLRANRAALADYVAIDLGGADGESLPVPPVDCGVAACSAAELVSWDLWHWERALDGATSGDGEGGLVRATACLGVAGRRVSVDIVWQGFRDPGAQHPDLACGAGRYGSNNAQRQWLGMTSWVGEE